MTRKHSPFLLALPVLMLGALACACLGSGIGLGGASATARPPTTQAIATSAKAAATQARATPTKAPATQAPATRAPATQAPATQAAATEALATQAAATPTANGNTADLADGKAQGPASARVTVAEYADFQCPWCQEFHNTVEGQLVQEYVKTGKVRLEYHHFIVIDMNVGGHESERAAEASECASAQGKFWPYHDTLFAHQAGEGSGAFTDARLNGFAETLGLDMTTFNQCFSSSQPAAAVQADMEKGLGLGVQGTPTVFINDVQVPDPFNYSAFKRLIDAALGQSS